MDEPEPEATEAITEEAAAPPIYPAGEQAQNGINLPLLGVLLLILLLVCASNIWLRRRAEREGSESDDESS